MTGAQLKSRIHRLARTSALTYTDADMLIDVNQFIEELAAKIQKVRPEIWNIPATDSLIANQREYALPTDTLNGIVSLEVKFSSTDNYTPATPIKTNPRDLALDEASIVAQYTNNDPFYFIRRNAFFLLSGTIITVSAGFRVVYNSLPAVLANLTGTTDLSADPTTTTHGFPREFHDLLARRCVINYKNFNAISLSNDDLDYDIDLENTLDQFSIGNYGLEESANIQEDKTDNGFNL